MYINTYRFESIVLGTKTAIPRIAIGIWHRRILVAKPTIDCYWHIKPNTYSTTIRQYYPLLAQMTSTTEPYTVGKMPWGQNVQ